MSFDLGDAAGLGALNPSVAIPVLTGSAQAGLNFYEQEKNYRYKKYQQNKEWEREDDAVQRRVADLKAAGLSPVLAAGSAAQAGPVVSTDAPQLGDLGIMSNALQFMQMQQVQSSIDKTAAEKLNIDMQTQKADAERGLTNLVAAKQAMDNKVQAEFGGSSNPGPMAKTVRDVEQLINSQPVGNFLDKFDRGKQWLKTHLDLMPGKQQDDRAGK